jgi:hypothetical protein
MISLATAVVFSAFVRFADSENLLSPGAGITAPVSGTTKAEQQSSLTSANSRKTLTEPPADGCAK